MRGPMGWSWPSGHEGQAEILHLLGLSGAKETGTEEDWPCDGPSRQQAEAPSNSGLIGNRLGML